MHTFAKQLMSLLTEAGTERPDIRAATFNDAGDIVPARSSARFIVTDLDLDNETIEVDPGGSAHKEYYAVRTALYVYSVGHDHYYAIVVEGDPNSIEIVKAAPHRCGGSKVTFACRENYRLQLSYSTAVAHAVAADIHHDLTNPTFSLYSVWDREDVAIGSYTDDDGDEITMIAPDPNIAGWTPLPPQRTVLYCQASNTIADQPLWLIDDRIYLQVGYQTNNGYRVVPTTLYDSYKHVLIGIRNSYVEKANTANPDPWYRPTTYYHLGKLHDRTTDIYGPGQYSATIMCTESGFEVARCLVSSSYSQIDCQVNLNQNLSASTNDYPLDSAAADDFVRTIINCLVEVAEAYTPGDDQTSIVVSFNDLTTLGIDDDWYKSIVAALAHYFDRRGDTWTSTVGVLI